MSDVREALEAALNPMTHTCDVSAGLCTQCETDNKIRAALAELNKPEGKHQLSQYVTPQPAAIPNSEESIWGLVMRDMDARDEFGRAKHGTPLQINDGRDHLIDAYQEALDLVVYLRQEIEQRKHDAQRIAALEAEVSRLREDNVAQIQRVLEIVDELIATHANAYRKADLVGNEDAMCFIAGLRDGVTGVRAAIRREFPEGGK